MYQKIEKNIKGLKLVTLLNKAVMDFRYEGNEYVIDTSEIVAVSFLPNVIERFQESALSEPKDIKTTSIVITLSHDSIIFDFFIESIPTEENQNDIKVLFSSICDTWLFFKKQMSPSIDFKAPEA